MNLSRRTLLTSVAPGAALAVAGCSTAQVAQYQAEWATIVGQIQAGVAKVASYIPTVETIAAEAAALFGPQYTAIVTAGSAALNQIIAVLINVANNLTPPAASKMRARLRSSSPGAPITIGTSPQGVVVTGFKV